MLLLPPPLVLWLRMLYSRDASEMLKPLEFPPLPPPSRPPPRPPPSPPPRPSGGVRVDGRLAVSDGVPGGSGLGLKSHKSLK